MLQLLKYITRLSGCYVLCYGLEITVHLSSISMSSLISAAAIYIDFC